MKFEVSGVTTGTTRTLTVPNASGTILLGTGTSTRVPYFNSTNELTTEAGFEYDSTNDRLAVTALDLGASTISGSTRTLRAQGSATDIGLDIRVKGAGVLQVISGGQLTLTSQSSHTSIGGSNLSIHTSSPNFQSMSLGVFLGNSLSAPSGNPADGNFIYAADISSSSVLHVRNEAGQIFKMYQPNAGSPYTVTNGTTDRTFDANSTTLDELADVLYTLITDLKTRGSIA